MTDFSKLSVPLIIGAAITVISYFFSDHIGDLRQGPTLVFTLDDTPNRVSLTISNVGNQRMEDVGVTLACMDSAPVCFKEGADGFFEPIRRGSVTVREISERLGHGSGQINLIITLMPDAKLDIVAEKVADFQEPIEVSFDSPADLPLRLIEGKGATGYIIVNYLQVLVWGVWGAFAVLASFTVFIVLVFFKLYIKKFRRRSSEAVDPYTK